MRSQECHESFLARLRDSEERRIYTGKCAESYGSEVVIPETREAPTAEDWRDYSDSGDLIIDGKLVEVRHILYDFTCLDDWPFGDRFIVDSAGTFDRKDPVPDRYIHWNKAKTHYGKVSIKKHRQDMQIGFINHKYTGERNHRVYFIHPKHIDFLSDPGIRGE